MNFQEGKEKFLCAWGMLASNWGINRTMAQVHSLLLISPKALNADMIMAELKISRGNANMNIRALLDWRLIYKEIIPGERKEYFVAEKDIWEVFRRIVEQRKKKELEPIIKLFDEVSSVKEECESSKEFCKMVKELKVMSCQADSILTKITKTDPSWVTKGLIQVLK
jgi:DNA-binding transcriptional regulator GbsR (MarR family)